MTFTYTGKAVLRRLYQMHPGFRRLQQSVDDAKILSAQILIETIRRKGMLEDLGQAEFQVFSQFGDDGIIQYLIHALDVQEETFIEFGSSNYVESNTRFLAEYNDWRGLLIDGDRRNIEYIKRGPSHWRHDVTAVAAFVTRDNINKLFRDNGFEGGLGLLSIDIDGNDYWVWEAISVVRPVIVVSEYNSTFGWEHAVTVPYDAAFDRFKAHYSGLFWGASLKALCLLAERKGYLHVGCNRAGNNAYFVRSDKIGSLKARSPTDSYRGSSYRESRDRAGRMSLLRGKHRFEAIQDLDVVDVSGNRTLKLRDLCRCSEDRGKPALVHDSRSKISG
jgi:hypothetical protein